jgi:hypothetical protein
MPYTIRKVRLTQDGYEMGEGRYPRYWGNGMPLYRVIDKESGDYLSDGFSSGFAVLIAMEEYMQAIRDGRSIQGVRLG